MTEDVEILSVSGPPWEQTIHLKLPFGRVIGAYHNNMSWTPTSGRKYKCKFRGIGRVERYLGPLDKEIIFSEGLYPVIQDIIGTVELINNCTVKIYSKIDFFIVHKV